jgi:hypothetical protein
MTAFAQAVDASAGGAFLTASGAGLLVGASLRAGVDAATATIRETDGSGRILAVLSAPAANDPDHFTPAYPVVYVGNIHVTLTGTAPKCIVYQA